MAPSASFFFSSFQGSSRKRFLIRWKNSGTDLGSFRNPGNRKIGSGGDSEMSGNRKWSLWNLTVSFPASKCRMNIDLHQLTPDHSTVSLKKQTTCQKNTNKSDQIWEIWEEIELWKALIRQKTMKCHRDSIQAMPIMPFTTFRHSLGRFRASF